MNPILTLTLNPSVDTTTEVDRVEPDRKLRCAHPTHEPGGGGLNVARAIRNMGGAASPIYPAGGPIGDLLGQLLASEGIEPATIEIGGETRENLTVMEQSTGQQYRFVMSGPTLSEDEQRRCLELLRTCQPRPDYVVASGSLPPGVPEDFYRRVAEVVHGRGSRFVLDTSGRPLRAACGEGVFLLKPNKRELGQIAGRELTSREDVEEAANDLVRRCQARVVVVSLGAEGALVVTEGRNRFIPAPEVETVSTVGAGDSMVGGVVLGLARGMDVEQAAALGVAAGAAAAITPGTELCRGKDVERLYREIVGQAAGLDDS